MLNTVTILTGASGWVLPAAGFSNPSYLAGPAPRAGDALASLGFDITGAGGVVIAFEGTYTGQTVAHQQTMDPTGLTGWFAAVGVPIVTSSSSTSTGSTSGVAYVFPAVGVRHRIQVTALATGIMVARIGLAGAEITQAAIAGSGGGGGSLTTLANAAAPAQTEGATPPLSVNLFTALRVLNTDPTTGAPLDPAAPLNAGTNTIGAVVPVPRATANGATSSRVVSVAGAPAGVSLKGTAGNLVNIDLFNVAAYSVFVKFYNIVGPTIGTTTPVWTIPIAAGTGYARTFDLGKSFSTAMVFAITKLQADTDTTAVAAGDVTGAIDWI